MVNFFSAVTECSPAGETNQALGLPPGRCVALAETREEGAHGASRGAQYLQVARGREHRLHGPHAVVVVMLRRQLLGAQAVSGHDFHRQGPRRDEPTGVQDDFGDHGIVGHHHGYCPEEGLRDGGRCAFKKTIIKMTLLLISQRVTAT